MELKLFKRSAGLLAAIGMWVCVSLSAPAAMVTFDLNSVITGDSPANVPTPDPWVRAVFNDAGLVNQVRLTLSALNLAGNEDVGTWLFNIDPNVTQAQLDTLRIESVTMMGGEFNVDRISLIRQVVDGVTRAGFSFDFNLGLPKGSAANRFTDGDTVEIILGTTPYSSLSLVAGLFDFRDDTGTYSSAAHIRNTTGAEGSGWIGTTPIPETPTWIAGAFLLLPFAASTLRFVRKHRRA